MGSVAVPKLNVILALMCLQYGNEIEPQGIGNEQLCNTPAIHARMARFMVFANLISGVGCAISSPRIGRMSDRYGRKPLLAFTALGLLFGDVISMVAGLLPNKISVYWVLLEYGIGGLTGTFAASMAILQSYAADCTNGEARGTLFSQIHASMYLGVALGPAVGGLFIKYVGRGDMLSVLYAATICHAGFICFVILGIRESLQLRIHTVEGIPTASTQASKLRSWLQECNILAPLKILRPPRDTSSRTARRNLPLLASIDGVAFGIQLGLSSLLVLYSEYRLRWRTLEASLFVSITNATRAIILTLIVPVLWRMMRRPTPEVQTSPEQEAYNNKATSDTGFSVSIIRLALLLDLLSHFGFAIAESTVLFTLSGVLAAAGAPISPTIQSLMTTYVDSGRIGELLGTVSLLHAIAKGLIPTSMQLIYSITLVNAPGAIFWILGGLFGSLFIVSLWIQRE